MGERVLHIAVDVSVAGEEISGHVRDGRRAPKAFSGWLALLAALDATIGAPAEEPGRQVPRARTPARERRDG